MTCMVQVHLSQQCTSQLIQDSYLELCKRVRVLAHAQGVPAGVPAAFGRSEQAHTQVS